MANKITAPEMFDFKKPDEWEKWIRRFGRYRMACDLHRKSEEIQVNTLLYAMGDAADDVMTTFVFGDEGDRLKYDKVKEKFDQYFLVRRNVIYERAKFNQRTQADETAEEFITSLHCLAEHCNFGALKEEMIRDRIVVGVKDATLSEKMQLESTLTLEKAVKMARESESVKKQQEVIRSGQRSTSTEIDEIGAKFRAQLQKFPPKKRGGGVGARDKSNPSGCLRCGLSANHTRGNCPALNSVCHKCSKKGHYARVCMSQQVEEVVTEDQFSEDPDSSVFLGEIGVDSMHAHPWKADILVNGCPVSFKLDSGADVSVISEKTFGLLSIQEKLLPPDKKLYGPCKVPLFCKGKFTASLTHNLQCCADEIYVVPGLEQSLLGRRACSRLGTIARISGVDSKDSNYEKRFPSLFQGLGCMDGVYEIKLDESVTPFNLCTPRRIPIPLLPQVKKELERMEQMGVIEQVDQPTQWCSPIVVVPKRNGSVRICGDFVQLNKAVQREVHQMPTTEQTLAKLSGAKIMSKLDANSGFWQRKLGENSKLFTTFITPWGRYCFTRLPFGISSAPEHFQKAMQRILEGLDGVECQVDDILVFGETQEQHDKRLIAVLERLADANVTLNLEKCKFSTDKVEFLGHVIGKDGVQIDPTKVEAVAQMGEPTDIAQLRRFLGMVNQVGKYIPNLADMTKPLRDLLSKNNAWLWTGAQQEAFNAVKTALVSTPTLALYDPAKETRVSSDASSFGLGAVLTQAQEDGGWKPVAFISRALTPTEQRYAQVEKEALAVTWACERLSDYLIGKPFHIETDHKPLVPLLGSKNLNEMPPRIQRLRMRLLRFQYSISHVPGKSLTTADALSRAPINQEQQSGLQEEEIALYAHSVLSEIPASDRRLEEIRERQEEDEVCRQLTAYCQLGWPEKDRVPEALKGYWSERGEITLVRGLLLKASRVIIPSCMRIEILDRLHEGHQGITKCRSRAKMSVWWPGLSRQIEDMVQGCRKCAEHRSFRAEPLIPSVVPNRPWQIIGTDLLQLKGRTYLLVVDYFSRYIELALLSSSQTSQDVIQALKSMFARHGIPDSVRSDNGPQYSSAEFIKFAKEWGFASVTSSPKYPQSNGMAERAVQTAKYVLKKEDDPAKALLAYRSTPLENGYSPAELLFGRKIRSRVPIAAVELKPGWPDLSIVRGREEVRKQEQKAYFDSHHGARDQKKIPVGTEVWIRDMKVPATVTQEAETPRSYIVSSPRGTIRRNRKDLTPLYPSSPDLSKQGPSFPDSSKQIPEAIKLDVPAAACAAGATTTRSGRVVSAPRRLDL